MKALWNVGPKDDYDEIARILGDAEWDWDHAHERFKKVLSPFKCEKRFLLINARSLNRTMVYPMTSKTTWTLHQRIMEVLGAFDLSYPRHVKEG